MPSGMIGHRLPSPCSAHFSNSQGPLSIHHRDRTPQTHRGLAEGRWLSVRAAAPCRRRFDAWRPRATTEGSSSEEDEGLKEDRSMPKKPGPPLRDSAVFLMRLPFLYASTLASTNDHYLQQRGRTRWWSRGKFPRVGPHTLKEAMQDENVNHPFKLLVKMAPLGIIFFCATFNLCILQNMKDALIVSTIGAESLPFLASFGVLPASFLFFAFYHKMLNKLPQRRIFYMAVLPLLALYTVFVTAMYPASNWLHLHGFFDVTSAFVPLGFHGLLRCIENWTYSLFFCVAELWGAVVISVLFWSLANDVCSVTEAKTIYPSMGISANVALVFAGKLVKWINQHVANGSTLVSYRCLIGIVVFSSCVMMAAKLFIDKNVPTHHTEDVKSKGSKKKGSFRDGLAVLKQSPKILNLALLVIGYSVSHRLFDVVWKGQLKLVYPTSQEYQGIMADVSIWTGMVTITMMLTGKFIFQHLGWGVAASAPPIIMLFTGSVFYLSFLAFSNGASLEIAKMGAIAGNVTHVATRAAKFSLFDPAKEMVYIEMNKEEKGKGKAAVDLVSSQVGKTGAAWVSQALLLSFGSIAAAMPVFSCLYGCVIIVWLMSVKRLHGELKETERQRRKAKKRLKPSLKITPEKRKRPAVLERISVEVTEERHRHAASSNGSSETVSTSVPQLNGTSEGRVTEKGKPKPAVLNGSSELDVSPDVDPKSLLNGKSELRARTNRTSGLEESNLK